MRKMLALVTALLASANGGARSNREASVPTAPKLEGEWVSDCTPIGVDGRHGQIIRLVITRNRIEATGLLYAHNTCDVPTIRSEYSGAIRQITEGVGRLELDYEVRDATFTILRDDIVAIYNKSAGCGLADWQIDKPKSVAGRRCTPIDLPARGQMLFESAWVAGAELRLGAFPLLSANSSPEARPVIPGPMAFHRVAPAASSPP